MDLMDKMWQVLVAGLILAAFGMAILILCAPKNVDYYYLSHGGSQSNSYCVYAHWTWHPDEIAYCTDDYERALDFTAKANATLGVRK